MVMGRPTIYDSDEAKKRARQQRHQWNKDNYDLLGMRIPKGYNAKIGECAEKLNVSKRQFVIDVLEDAFRKYLK